MTTQFSTYVDFDEDRHINEEPDDRGLQINLTHEGLILDAWQANQVVATFAMTFDELWTWLARADGPREEEV